MSFARANAKRVREKRPRECSSEERAEGGDDDERDEDDDRRPAAEPRGHRTGSGSSARRTGMLGAGTATVLSLIHI